MGSSKRNEEPSKGGSSRAGRKTGLLKFAWRATKSRTFGKASADDQQPKIMNVVAGPSNHSTDADRVEVAIASATTAASSEAADASEACRKNDILAAKAEEAASTVKESLWDLAYDKLREEKPCVVEAYEELLARMLPYLAAESPATDLRDLLSKASSRHQSDSSAATKHDSAAYSVMTRREKMDDMIALGKKHMEGKKIALKVGDQEFVLQDQMKHVVAGLRIAKAWVDDAVNASPLARTAWASVCLLLPFLTNQSDVQAANDEGFAYVTQKIRYYAAMESLLFGADDTTFPPAFRDHVVGLYKEIIDFQAQTVLRFFRGRFSNFVRDTVRCDPGRIC